MSLPYATFLIAVKDGNIVDTAPIARWSLGKNERTVAAYFRRQGATFVDLHGH